MLNNRYYRLLFSLIMIFFAEKMVAQEQEKWSGFSIEAQTGIGKIIRHTPKFTGEIPKHSYALELHFLKQTYGQKDWHQRRNFPTIGFGLIYIDYNHPSFGSVFGFFPTIQLPLLKNNHLEWLLRAGMGIGYVTKPHERMPNPNRENVVIGGHLNNVSPFSTSLRWTVNEHWKLNAGLSLTHVSNASYQQPNLGINLFGLQIGAQYAPITNQPEKIRKTLPDLENRWLFHPKVAIAFVEKRPADGPLYPVYHFAGSASKRYLSKNKVFGGVDFTYNTGMYSFLKSIEEHRDKEFSESYQLAVFIGNEFLLGKIGIVAQLGYYLKEMYLTKEIFYQKIGGHFYFYQSENGFLKEVYATALLKTHKADAELFEMGIALSF